MPITEKDVLHIANLARIKLCDTELKKFEHELSSILEFVEKLNEANTTGVKPFTGGTVSENVMREDKVTDSSLEGKTAAVIKQVPEIKETWVKVRAVF